MSMRILLAVYMLLCLTLLLLMDLGRAPVLLTALRNAPYGDKALHVVFAGTLGLLLNLTLLRLRVTPRWRALLAGAALAALVCTVEEASNALTPFRGCEALDLAANYAGILLLGVAPLVRRTPPSLAPPVEVG